MVNFLTEIHIVIHNKFISRTHVENNFARDFVLVLVILNRHDENVFITKNFFY